MPYLSSKLKIDDEKKENFSFYLQKQKILIEALERATLTEQLDHLKKLNKLTVEERISKLCDTRLFEIGTLAGYRIYDNKPGANIRTLVAKVQDKFAVVIANDPSEKGGSYYPLTVKKHLRAQKVALDLGLPCIYLVDSGGAFLPLQDEVFPDKEHFGRIFYNQARLSARGVAQISLVLGSSTAGGAYVPALSDFVVIVNKQGRIFLGGPPLVKAATGLDIDPELLGGAEVHTRVSGVADNLAMSEEEGIQLIRKFIVTVEQKEKFKLNVISEKPPEYDPLEIPYILPKDPSRPVDSKEVLARLLDESYLEEFKPLFGSSLICGFGRIKGILVGILCNDGILFSESALKGCHFIQYCNKNSIPLLFLQNIVGFMVGAEYEAGGIAKDGAKLVSAVASCTVPKITLIWGNSFGAGNYAMCGRAYEPLFLFTWPTSRIGVMGGKQAASVLSIVKYGSADHPEGSDFREKIEQQYSVQTEALYATARLWDDGIILVEDTRDILANALTLCRYWTCDDNFSPSYRF